MNKNELLPDAQVELLVRAGSDTITLRSKIVDLVNGDILIDRLEHNGKLLGIPDHFSVDMLYLEPENSRPFLWSNVSLKVVRYKKEIYHCIGNLAETGKLTNRRESFRLFVGREMTLVVRDANGSRGYRVILKDISETGMGFVTKEDFPIKKLVRLDFEDNHFRMPLAAHIVRKIEPTDDNMTFVYGCRFSEPNPLLSKYIARKQHEKLQSQRA